jgi:Spy/CpxP family protein refolding chaperone
MKKLLLIAMLFTIGFAAMAQKGGQRGSATPEERAERITNKMAEELSLSDDQKKQIYQINLEHAKKRQAEMDARKAEMKAKRAEMEADMKVQNQEIEALLTEDQKAKWAEVKAEGRKKMEEEGRGRRGGQGGGHRGGGGSKM